MPKFEMGNVMRLRLPVGTLFEDADYGIMIKARMARVLCSPPPPIQSAGQQLTW
jgi:hypothetical protein